MKKVLFLVALLFILLATPTLAKQLVDNTTGQCSEYPLMSTCNLTRIMETNAITLGNMIAGDPKDPDSAKNSAISGMVSTIGLLIVTPPVSGRDFIAYESSKFHVPGTPTPVYAAPGGVGYNSLTPVLKIWVAMRNIAYFFFSIIFVIIGMMIMFRMKIDQKTVASVQNALPKIILALIVVTFSYAIAGFLIDIMYVAIALVLTIVGSLDITVAHGITTTSTKDLGENIVKNNIFTTIFDGNTWGNIGNASQAVNIAIQKFVGEGNAIQSISGQLLGLLGGAIGFLVIAVAIMYALFKTFISLLSAYANIILGVIFSPLQLMLDAIPGQNQLSGWVRTMLANLLAFPAVLVMILLGEILSKGNTGNIGYSGANPGFSPPLIGATDQTAVQALIGIAMILTTPKAVEILQKVLKAPENKFGSAWSEAVGWAWDKSPIRGARDAAWNGARGATYGNWYKENILPRIMEEEASRQEQAKFRAGIKGAEDLAPSRANWRHFLPKA